MWDLRLPSGIFFTADELPASVAALLWWNPVNWVGFLGLLILGFAMAPIFPLLVTATPLRLGAADAGNAIGFQVAAASFGIGVLPGLAGALADLDHLLELAASW